jgi:hypothetical protein
MGSRCCCPRRSTILDSLEEDNEYSMLLSDDLHPTTNPGPAAAGGTYSNYLMRDSVIAFHADQQSYFHGDSAEYATAEHPPPKSSLDATL